MNQESSTSLASLVVVEGPDRGRICFLNKETISLGRGYDDQFLLRDAAVTRNQLVIEWDSVNAQHVLNQTGDSSTAINNIPASRLAGVKHALMDGDQVRVGGTVLRYCLGAVAS